MTDHPVCREPAGMQPNAHGPIRYRIVVRGRLGNDSARSSTTSTTRPAAAKASSWAASMRPDSTRTRPAPRPRDRAGQPSTRWIDRSHSSTRMRRLPWPSPAGATAPDRSPAGGSLTTSEERGGSPAFRRSTAWVGSTSEGGGDSRRVPTLSAPAASTSGAPEIHPRSRRSPVPGDVNVEFGPARRTRSTFTPTAARGLSD